MVFGIIGDLFSGIVDQFPKSLKKFLIISHLLYALVTIAFFLAIRPDYFYLLCILSALFGFLANLLAQISFQVAVIKTKNNSFFYFSQLKII